jgi:GH24 family phage-related lysozyme (muramidase)
MALKSSVRDAVIKSLIQFEGQETSFYLDDKGNVTIGVGYMVSDRNAVAALSMYKVLPGGTPSISPATLLEKQQEYDTIANLGTGYIAPWYKKHTTLVMTQADIGKLLGQTVDDFYPQLVRIYSKTNGYSAEFDALPDEVQMALFDMVYNLGAAGLSNKFPKFNQAVKTSNWTTAASESNRPKLAVARNQYVKQLFTTVATQAAKPIK